jgi:hypothetical protein
LDQKTGTFHDNIFCLRNFNDISVGLSSFRSVSRVGATDCPPLGGSFTRYMIGSTAFPFRVNGADIGSFTFSTIMTEHYNNDSIEGSQFFERNWFAQGYGNLRWEVWGTSGTPSPNTDPSICPPILINGYYYPDHPNYYLLDCRFWTDVISAPPSFSESVFGWPFVN